MKVFLQAKWLNLLMANYKIDQKVLQPYIPDHTELDLFRGDCYVSLIGFLFADTKIKGLAFPYHTTFEEINLRFYVKHKANGVWRRGVVFIKEIVPRHMITLIANTLYDENYITLPTRHHWHVQEGKLEVSYSWKFNGQWNKVHALAESTGNELVAGSKEEFITEHYWGYAQNKKGFTTEYEVTHPRWKIHQVLKHDIVCDFEALYGNSICNGMEKHPSSVFLAAGSEIKVMDGRKI